MRVPYRLEALHLFGPHQLRYKSRFKDGELSDKTALVHSPDKKDTGLRAGAVEKGADSSDEDDFDDESPPKKKGELHGALGSEAVEKPGSPQGRLAFLRLFVLTTFRRFASAITHS